MARPNYYNPGKYEGVVSELKTEFQRSILVPRTTKTNFEPFRSRFGFELPDDIKAYINLYWHSYIEGAYDCYKQDEDGDGLSNLQEYQLGTDPQNEDSDYDV